MTSFISKQASKLLSGVALTFALANSAQAITFDIATNGTLMGASGVSVNGTLYDVTFGDDTYTNAITAFTTADSAKAASQALIDQVLVGDYYSYNRTKLINGCNNGIMCSIYTAYGFSTNYGAPVALTSGVDQMSKQRNRIRDFIFVHTNSSESTVAKWTVSKAAATAVPEPEAYAMMLAGLGLVGFAARRKQQAA